MQTSRFRHPEGSEGSTRKDVAVTFVARWLILLLSLGVAGYGLYAYLLLPPGTTVHPAIKAA
jgi:hypothetical protein